MQRSATVFHSVREAKVTTNWRGTESACTYRFDPLRTVRVVVLVGKQVSAREAYLQPALASPTLGMRPMKPKRLGGSGQKTPRQRAGRGQQLLAALQRDWSAKCLMDRSAAAGNLGLRTALSG